MWEVASGSHRVYLINDPPDVSPPFTPQRQILTPTHSQTDAGVTSVAISPDGKFVAAGSLDTFVRIWDSQSGVLVEQLAGHKDSVYSVAFTPDGRGLVSGSLDQTLKYWDMTPLMKKRPVYDGVKKEEKCSCIVTFNGHKVRFTLLFILYLSCDF